MTCDAELHEQARMRARRAVAWSLAAFAIAVTLVGVVLVVMKPEGNDDGPFAVLIPIVLLVFPIMGALVVAQKPENLIGWFFCAFGFTGSIGGTAEAYATFSGSEWANWVALITIDNPTMFTYFVFILLLFPNGKLPSPRWRHLAGFSIVTSALLWFFIAFKPGSFNGRGAVIEIAALDPIWKVVETPLVLSIPLSLLGAVAAIVFRFRRSEEVERHQLKWLVCAGLLVAVMVGLAPLVFAKPDLWWLWPLMFSIGAMSIPIACMIAIRRYRLYDIDRIITKALGYGALTVILGGVFALFVLIPSAVLGRRDTPDYVIAGSTLVVALLFRPLRRQVQQMIDRRFNRTRYNTERTIEAFAQGLRREIDVEAVGAELKRVTTAAMHPSHLTLWLVPDRKTVQLGR
jgi:hypothetical protein